MKKEFLFGTATAAFQCEGALTKEGRGKCIWDLALESKRALADYDPSNASAFYDLYEVDFKLAQKYGIKSMRVSLPWSRIFPKNNHEINQLAVKHYHEMFQKMFDYGLIPNVGLFHFDSPFWIVEEGDFLNKNTIQEFKKYAEFCFQEFKEIQMWSTINELNAYSGDKFLKGTIAPYIKHDYAKFIEHQHNMLLAHAQAVISFKKIRKDGEIGIPNSNNPYLPIQNTTLARIAADNANAFLNWFTAEAILMGKYNDDTLQSINNYLKNFSNWTFHPTTEDLKILSQAAQLLDWFGLNYYTTYHVDEAVGQTKTIYNSTGDKGTNEINIAGLYRQVKNPELETTEWDWPIYPNGMKILIERFWNDYGFHKPIYITENGYGNKEEITSEFTEVQDFKRIKYLQDHFNIIADLRDQGINIAGYYLWSHMDMLSWTNGYNKRYGLFFVDFKTQERYPKLSARWWKEKSESQILTETQASIALATNQQENNVLLNSEV